MVSRVFSINTKCQIPVCCTRSQQGLGQARLNKKLSQRGKKFARIENVWPQNGSCPVVAVATVVIS